MSSMEGAGGAPLLNDYKLEFFMKRWPQTLLGGLKLRLGYDAPFYVYLNQVVIFLVPLILGGVFTILSEFRVLDAAICCYVYGSLVTIFVMAVNLASWLARRKYSSVTRVQDNHLAQDDEIDFISCCGVETLEFLFPAKRFTINIAVHALLSGPSCALIFLYLLPSNLMNLFSSTAATVLLYIFGWFTLCVAQYSLTSGPPPEPAVFRPLDTLELKPLMRPFYVLVFGITGLFSGIWPEFTTADSALHIAFPFLLLLWLLGIMSPLDALFTWMAEQFLVLVLGGSPMATDLRLLTMLLLSSLTIILAVFIPSHLAVIILSSFLGYILSIDIIALSNHLWLKIRPLTAKTTTEDSINTSQWSLKEYIIHAAMLVLGTVVPAIAYNFSADASQSIADSMGYLFIALLVVVKVTGDFQGVYLIFGLLRNPFFPKSIHSESAFKERKKQLRYIAMLRHVLLTYVCPLLMTAYLGLFLAPHSVTMPTALVAFGTVRALRQVWQNTFTSLIEVSLVCIINTQLYGGGTVTWWHTAGLGVQLMLVGACRDRIWQLIDKLVFAFTLAVTSASLPKQRHKATVPLLIVSAILFPVVLGIVGASAFLSAPLLPLFCLPLFLIGFPRPQRSWPHTGSTPTSTCVDAVYYKQLAPEVARTLSVSMASGAVGNPSPGDHLLVRFQDRLVWIHVLECGYRYCSAVIKGLEMQETSCHTVEAARVDEVLDAAFVHEDKGASIYCNPYPWNMLRPCDAVIMKTYSDARNVLTGIIDQPDNLRKVSENLLKTSLWVLMHHCKGLPHGEKATVTPEKRVATPTPEIASQVIANPAVADTHVGDAREEFELTQVATHSTKNSNESYPAADVEVHEAGRVRRSSSLPSLSDSVWSRDSLSLSINKSKSPNKLNHPLLADVDDEDDDDPFDLYGFPALDIGKPQTVAKPSGLPGLNSGAAYGSLPNTVTHSNVAPSSATKFNNNATNIITKTAAAFESKHSYKLDLPTCWKADLPIPSSKVPTHNMFPTSWYKHIMKVMDIGDGSENIREELINDGVLQQMYERLVLTCYALVEVVGYPGSSSLAAGPSHAYKVFSGVIPWSLQLDWLQQDKTLLDLVIKAYRYAFKLMYDEAVLGEVSDDEELADYMQEYDSDWFMGSDIDSDWQKAVLEGRPNLFSVGRDKQQGVYTSRVLSKQSLLAPMGRLNPEAVRGQWASLALELLYLTNDDEERYSIQAHPVLLRNLTIQAADPPLGYPVYSSGAVHISVGMPPL